MYLDNGNLEIELLGRGFAWLDTGTHKSLLEASMFIETLEKRQGFKIACLEEISWRKGWISNEKIKSIANSLNGSSSSYGKYLNNLIRGNEFI
jgi:glucose-1-phosphate thymidylyltransferase